MYRIISLILALPLLAQVAIAQPVEPLVITSTAVPLDHEAEQSVAPLKAQGVYELNSDHGDFGGISGMRLGSDHRIYLITDAGQFIAARMDWTEDNQFTGLKDATISPLTDPEGEAIPVKSLVDSESLIWGSDEDHVLISFEFRHRVWRYELKENRLQNPVALGLAPHLSTLPDNGGIEAMARLDGGDLLLFSEQGRLKSARKAWRYQNGQMLPFTYGPPAPYVPTDAVNLGDGQILILNRHFSPLSGVSAELTVINEEAVQIGAQIDAKRLAKLTPPFPVDNFEAIDAMEREDGWDIFILSDDNFNAVQKTLLLHLFLPKNALPQ